MNARAKAFTAILDHFTAQWGGTLLTATENNPVKQPEAQPWGRLSLAWGQNDPATISTTQSRCVGMLTLQVFMPEETGTAAAREAADKLDELFRFRTFELALPNPSTGRVVFQGGCDGPTSAGLRDGYTQHNIRLAFRLETEN